MARKATSPLQFVLRQPEPARHPAEDAFAFAGGILLGALIGAIIAILLTPTDGETLRRQVASRLGMGEPEPLTEPVGAQPPVTAAEAGPMSAAMPPAGAPSAAGLTA
jgi:hypothetical protein